MTRTGMAFSKGKAFIPFITAGDPDIATTEKLVLAMAESGADLIEIGVPFSDPMAEGPVIQKADERERSREGYAAWMYSSLRCVSGAA